MSSQISPKIKKLLELSILRALPEFCILKVKRGRLQTLYRVLKQETDIELAKITPVSKEELRIIENMLNEFSEKTGWEGKEKHVVTLISFCLAIIDASNYKYSSKLVETLIKIFEYYERNGKAPAACFWGGDIASKKWIEIMQNTTKRG